MGNTVDYIEVKSYGDILPKKGTNSRTPYEHQKMAMQALDKMNQETAFSTLVVIPTGGGKTYTASMWLLKNAIDKKKKILWIAHRQMLLDQAAESFQKFAYTEVIPHVSSFCFRIVSGASTHDRTIDIRPDDNLLIVSKDSLGRNMDRLEKWIHGEKELFLIVDEAHHATAKTYRKIIDYVKSQVPNLKMIGLTATPFRTSENEQGLLAKIFTDGIKNGQTVHGDVGITYQIGLKELINSKFPIAADSIEDGVITATKLDTSAINSILHGFTVRRFDSTDSNADNTGMICPEGGTLQGFYIVELGILVLNNFAGTEKQTGGNVFSLPSYVPSVSKEIQLTNFGLLGWNTSSNFANWTGLKYGRGRHLIPNSAMGQMFALVGSPVAYLKPYETSSQNASYANATANNQII